MTVNVAWTDHFWRSREGLNLHARAYGESAGEALPVVCIPGLTRNARDFEEVAPWIATQGRRVYAVDLRGRSQSDRDPDPRRYQPRVYAQDMLALLQSIGAPKSIFIGTSLGGLVTMALAASHRHVIGGAVINDVGPRVAKGGLARIRSYVGKTAPVNTWDDAAAYAKSINAVAFPDALEQSWSVAGRLFKDEGGRPVLDYDPKIFRPANAVVAWLAGPLLWSAFKQLGKAGPLLLVYGEITDVLDAETRQRMKQVAPNLVAVGVPRVGHAPWLSEPSARDAIGAFLAKAP